MTDKEKPEPLYDPRQAQGYPSKDELSDQARKLLAGLYKTACMMRTAYSKRSDRTMFVWADDLYAVEAVMSFLESIRDADTRPDGNSQ